MLIALKCARKTCHWWQHKLDKSTSTKSYELILINFQNNSAEMPKLDYRLISFANFTFLRCHCTGCLSSWEIEWKRYSINKKKPAHLYLPTCVQCKTATNPWPWHAASQMSIPTATKPYHPSPFALQLYGSWKGRWLHWQRIGVWDWHKTWMIVTMMDGRGARFIMCIIVLHYTDDFCTTIW